MLSTATVGFCPVVQLFPLPTNPAMHVAEKIHFINPQKPYCGCQQCAHKY